MNEERRAAMSLTELVDLSQFSGVTLDELNSHAALLTRRDRKYVVPADVVVEILLASRANHRLLDIDGRREFAYESTYCDTPDLLSWRLAAGGRRRRFKVRFRDYLNSDLRMLEVKTEAPRSATAKERMQVPRSNLMGFAAAEASFVSEALVAADVTDESEADAIVARLAPSVSSAYRRCTFAESGNGARVTVDTGLIGGSAGAAKFTLSREVIIETKTLGPPCDIDRRLWACGIRPERLSKFAIAMAFAHPELPANRWNRALRQHCDWTPQRRTPVSA